MVGLVAKDDIVKFDFALDVSQFHQIFTLRLFLRLIQKFKHALSGSGGRLQHIGNVSNLHQRLVELVNILDEGLDVADFQPAINRQPTAQNRHHNVADVADEIHDWINQTRQKLSFPGAFLQLIVHPRKLSQRLFLAVEHAHHLMAAVHFLDMAVQFTQLRLLAEELLLRAFGNQRHHAASQRQHQ